MNSINLNSQKRAVIYCRVSTKEQVDEGNSLNVQEKTCRDYTIKNNYEIAEVFIEQGESAKTQDRTELQKLLLYCSDKKNRVSAVIIYKIDRLSRNTDDYSQLRLLLKRYGVEIKSTTEFFENTPAGRFMENIISNVAQFDNDVRAERCSGGMKIAMREGRYVWKGPIGYSNVRVGGKATIAPDDMAPLVKKTFEVVASGLYSTDDVRKIMGREGLKLKSGKLPVKGYFHEMLRNKLYTGWIEKFGEKHKGLFEPIISEELFEQVQRVLRNKGKKMSQYITDNPDFPLRRFIKHPPTGLKLTGSWSKSGSGKKYAFYRFGMKGSNYNKDEFEKNFSNFMDEYSFDQERVNKLKAKIKEQFHKATLGERKQVENIKALIQQLTEKQNALIQKNLSGVISDTVLKQQLDIIDREINDAQGALSNSEGFDISPEEAISYAEQYLLRPSSVWRTALLPTKLKLQWFQFPQGITFNGIKFGTDEISFVFKAKEAFLPLKSSRVDRSGFGHELLSLLFALRALKS